MRCHLVFPEKNSLLCFISTSFLNNQRVLTIYLCGVTPLFSKIKLQYNQGDVLGHLITINQGESSPVEAVESRQAFKSFLKSSFNCQSLSFGGVIPLVSKVILKTRKTDLQSCHLSLHISFSVCISNKKFVAPFWAKTRLKSNDDIFA